MGFFEAGAKDALKMSLTAENRDLLNQASVSDFQVILRSKQNTQPLRTLTAEHANLLIKVSGIVISSSKTKPRATLICIRCTKCQCVKVSLQSSFPYLSYVFINIYIYVSAYREQEQLWCSANSRQMRSRRPQRTGRLRTQSLCDHG